MENCHVLDAYCINVHACNELVCPKGWKIPWKLTLRMKDEREE